jgi:hypothetical protein
MASNEPEVMTMSAARGVPQKVAASLRLGGGFSESDQPQVLRALEGLEHHLAGWRPDQLDLEVSVKDRDGPEQKVTLNAFMAGWPRMVATASDRDLGRALGAVKRELVRQIDERRDQRKPDHNKRAVHKSAR